ncbi:AAA family ATPase [Patescibacteria group bacterium]|nr:AAA family ATPase [Patescibacteria group bacterium]
MIILGITGTLGAGKGTVAEYLKEKGFNHYSVRAFLTEEIVKRGMPVNRDSMVLVANELRVKNGPSYILDTLYERAEAAGADAVIESIRTVGEVEELRKKGMLLLSVDADPQIRYSRVQFRKTETDHISFETFMDHELRESEGDDPAKQNLRHTVKLADYHVTNDGTIDDLKMQVDTILATIRKHNAE